MDESIDGEGSRITRRGSLVKLGGFLAAVLAAGGWKAASGEDEAEGVGLAGVASGAVRCVLAPEQTEGPYYIANEKVRRNVTEGRPGTPLSLRLKVVDASTCKPIKGAAVDIWHCDGGGTYSGFGQGTGNRTFMRGVQKTDANGIARFRTVYPGWYRGRTVHIHVKVYLGGNVLHTGQLYFPDTVTDAVYRKNPYRRRPGRDTRNSDDFVYRNGGRNSKLSLRKAGTAGYIGTITMGVQR
jgi:intradiol ring-cleaving dioxygenase-like protein